MKSYSSITMIKRNVELLGAILGFAIILGCYLIFELDEKIALGLLGIVATLYLGALKQRIERDRFFKELFQDFNSRYDHKINDLINKLRYDPTWKLKKKERNIIIDYLNLCSEEYLWRRKNRIPQEVWESWKAGILENLKIEQIWKIYQEEISTSTGAKSFYGLVQELEKEASLLTPTLNK